MPAARTSDPDTSHAAARSAAKEWALAAGFFAAVLAAMFLPFAL